MPAAYSEVYRLYVARDDAGKTIRCVQTESDHMYFAKTHIDAPNPSWSKYEDLWANYER